MKTLLKLSWRNIWRNKRRSFISIASVLFAVFFASMADSFERGTYELSIKNMVELSTGYMQIQDVLYEEEPSIDNILLYDNKLRVVLNNFENVIDYTVPRIQNFVLAAGESKTRGALVMGIDPGKELQLNNLDERIIEGSFISEQDDAVVIAEGFARALNLKVGDTLVLIGQGFQGVNAAGLFPIKGIVKLSVPDMNNNSVYMPLETAQWFFNAPERISSLLIMPKKPEQTNKIAEKLNQELDSEWYIVLTWEQMLEDLLKMMQVDRAGSRLIAYILYIVIAFGLFGTIVTMMLERIKEFRMMISIGMKRMQLAIICMLESIFLSFIGVILGLSITFPIALYFNRNPIALAGELVDMMDDYGFEAVIPTSIAPDIFITESLTVFVISLLIGMYPVYKVYTLKMNRD